MSSLACQRVWIERCELATVDLFLHISWAKVLFPFSYVIVTVILAGCVNIVKRGYRRRKIRGGRRNFMEDDIKGR
jgi:hypothetical protein